MKITADDILAVEPSTEILCTVREFDYVDVVDFSTKPDIAPDSRVLWCVTKSTTEEDLSWYGTRFDRSAKVDEVSSKHPRWVALTESGQIAGAVSNRCILVPDVGTFLKRLHRHVITAVKPVVLGVTGSVGKTTCVALLEDIFSQYGKTLRIYAKRITPFSLFEIVINRLEREHRYVVMEYAMFHRWHIAELADLLEPTVGVLLNVSTEHVGVDGLRTTRDIFISKKSLLDRARYPFVEQDVARRFKEYLRGVSIFDWRDFISPHGFDIEPFLKSRLQYIQIGAALSVKEFLIGEATPADIAVINRFEPRENRLRKIQCRRHRIFFDGEVTTPSRLNALGDSMYSPRVLAVHAVADDEHYHQDMALQAGYLRSALQKFDSVYVSRTVDERFRLLAEQCASDATSVALYDDRIPSLPDATLFVHWGSYWRTHHDESAIVDAF